MKKWIKPAIFVLFLVTLVIVSRLFHLDQKVGDFRDWVAGLGTMGPVVFAGACTLTTEPAFPGSALTIMAGVIFSSVISEITTAMAMGIGLGKLAGIVHPYPTQADAIRRVAGLYKKTGLTPTVGGILKWWLKIHR